MRYHAPLFDDRADAGRQLARALAGRVTGPTVVLALPRGAFPSRGGSPARSTPRSTSSSRAGSARRGIPSSAWARWSTATGPRRCSTNRSCAGSDRRYLEGEITARAALRAARRAGAQRVVLAVAVAPPDTIAALRDDVDDLVCLSTPEPFGSVGRFYRDEVAQRLARKVAVLAEGLEAQLTLHAPWGSRPAS